MANKWIQAIAAGLQGMGGNYHPELFQQRELAEMRQDAQMGIRGFQRLDDNEIKDHVREQYLLRKTKGFVAEGGAVLPTKGEKNEYLPGYEPKPLSTQIKKSGDYLAIGNTYYKFNLELAEKMGVREAAPKSAIDKIIKEFSNTVANSAPTWNPPTPQAPMAAPTYRAVPMSALDEESAPTLSERDEVRLAIENAMSKNIPRADIIQGIIEEKHNPNDYNDLLNSYDAKSPTIRRKVLGDTISKTGVNEKERLSIYAALSNDVNKRKQEIQQSTIKSQTGSFRRRA